MYVRQWSVVITVSVASFVGMPVHASTVYDNLSSSPDEDLWALGDSRRWGQQFILDSGDTVSEVELKLRRLGSPSGSIAVEIWDDSGVNTPRRKVSNGEIGRLSDLGTMPTDLSDFTFDSSVSGLIPDEKYWVVLNYEDSSVWDNNSIGWASVTSSVGTNNAAKAVATPDRGGWWGTVSNTVSDPRLNYFMMSVESNGLPLESVPLSGLGDLYSQDFDDVLGIDGQATDQRFPAGWAFSDDGVFFDDATTTKFPVGPNFASDSTFNAGAENNSDRALAIGVASTNDQPMLQLLGHVTESDATSLQLSFDIEAWDARQLGSLPVDLADVPGEAAFKVIVEVDSGEGFTEALNFGTVTTGAVLELPDGDHLDGNVSPNRVSFDSGIQPVALANGSTLRLRWTADNEAQTRGWVFGLDNVALSLFSATPTVGDFSGDGALDVSDVDSLVGEIVAGTNNILFDLTGDGAVDKGDLTAWLSVAAEHNGFSQAYLPGDSNLDGSVDSADLNNLALSWRQDATRWSAGDFTADGSVSPLDLNELALNWRQSIAIAASTASLVPEPSNIAMLLGGLVLLRIRRRRRR